MFKAFKLQKPRSEVTFNGVPVKDLKVELITRLVPPKIPLRFFTNVAQPGLPGRMEFYFPNQIEGSKNVDCNKATDTETE